MSSTLPEKMFNGHPSTRPEVGDYCHACGAEIADDVIEFAIFHSEVYFICEFCRLNVDEPIPFVVSECAEDIASAQSGVTLIIDGQPLPVDLSYHDAAHLQRIFWGASPDTDVQIEWNDVVTLFRE
jgi:hypothetical protein